MAALKRTRGTWILILVLAAVFFVTRERGGLAVPPPPVTVISTTVPLCGPFAVPGDLIITGSGHLSGDDPAAPSGASACSMQITVGGNLLIQAGGSITADNTHDGGSGGDIDITVAGNMTLDPGSPGGLISARKTSGAGDTGTGGDIRIVVGGITVTGDVAQCVSPNGDVSVGKGALITSSANGPAGSIKIYAGHNIAIDGSVLAEGTSGAGHGGAITLKACCDLLVDDDGVVSSKGADPGADLVHLEACTVEIFGLVQSTGPGHIVPPNNLCNVNRPGKPANSTGCVEIWSGTTILIDATGSKHGEVKADVGQSGGTQGTGWIDVLANLDIAIQGNPTTPYTSGGDNNLTSPAWAVHANMPLQNGHGGTIAVQSKSGKVTASGRAIQANSSTSSNGGKGGNILVEAGGAGSPGGDVNFGNASVQAMGDTTGGATKAGGSIVAHSFNGQVLGNAPGELNAAGGPPAGSVKLFGCLGITYTGASTPAFVVDAGSCGDPVNLPSPANTSLPLATCTTSCVPQTPTPTSSPTPTTTPGQLPGPPKDATILHGTQNTNNGANYTLRVAYQVATIAAFNAAGIVPANVTSAYLVLHVQNRGLDDPPNGWPGGAGDLIRAYRLNDGFEDWAEGNGFNFPTVVFRGTGPGVTWNCVTDSNIANDARDCSGPLFWDNGGQNVQGPPRSIAAASPNLVIFNNMPDGSQVWFDVTADVQAGIGPKDTKFYSFFVRKPSGAGFVSFYSREGAALIGNPTWAPQLVVAP